MKISGDRPSRVASFERFLPKLRGLFVAKIETRPTRSGEKPTEPKIFLHHWWCRFLPAIGLPTYPRINRRRAALDPRLPSSR